MNIIYGGSFNPPTKAHEQIVLKLKEYFHPSHIIIIPTSNNYAKENLLDFKDRYEMLQLLFPKEIVLDLEQKNQEYLGTYHTLETLSKEFNDLYFCMGADNLLTIKKWIDYKSLIENYNFIVFRRNHIDIEKFIKENLKEYASHFIIIDFDNQISSTQYRNKAEEQLLPKVIIEYIKEHNLYEKSDKNDKK